MSATAPDYIKGYEKILTAYGFWPSFHDAPARLIRESEHCVRLELSPFRPYICSEETINNQHPYNRYRVVFSFTGIIRDSAQAFGTDNIIFELGFSTPEYVKENGTFIVDLESAMGCDMEGFLRVTHGEVIEVKDVLTPEPDSTS